MLSDRSVANFRHFMKTRSSGPLGAYDAALPRTGIPLKEFEKGGAYDAVAGTALADFKGYLSLNLPREAMEKASGLLKNLLAVLDVDDDGELNPDVIAADDSRRRALARDAKAPKLSAEAEFLQRFPEAARIRHVW